MPLRGKAINHRLVNSKMTPACKYLQLKSECLYEATCALMPNLKMILDPLFTVWPTSTQNSRNISMWELLGNKDQNNLMGQLLLCVF